MSAREGGGAPAPATDPTRPPAGHAGADGAARALATLVLAAAALLVASTLAFVWQSLWPGPARDMWFFVPALADHWEGRGVWPHLLRPYAGHRIVFPKLLYLIEFRVFGGANHFLNGVAVGLQALSALLLARRAWRDVPRAAPPLRALLVALPPALLFSATQIENFVRGWNSAWLLALAGLVLALLSLARAHDARARGGAGGAWLAASVAAATVAAGSTANGLAAFPILVGLAWGLRLPARDLAVLALATAAALALFFLDYRVPSASDPGAALRDPAALLAWLVRFFGMPLSARHEGMGAALGALALAAGAYHALRFAARRPRRPLEAVHLGLVLAGLATGLATALGRIGRAYETWDDGRYQTFVMAFWLGLWALTLLRFEAAHARRARLAAGAGLLLWIGVVLAPAHRSQALEVRDLAVRIRAAQDAVAVGLADPDAYEATLSLIARDPGRPDQVARHAPFLREHGLGMFGSERAARLGRRVGSDLPVAEDARCSGAVLGARRFRDGVALFGSLADAFPGGRDLVVSDASRRVVGLGAPTRFGALRLEGVRTGPGSRAWIAFARGRAGEPLRVWAVRRDGALCPIGKPFEIVGGSP